jgi:hypothetical protein
MGADLRVPAIGESTKAGADSIPESCEFSIYICVGMCGEILGDGRVAIVEIVKAEGYFAWMDYRAMSGRQARHG